MVLAKEKYQRLTDIIKHKKFTISAEVIPPRNGSEMSAILQQIEVLRRAGVDFISVTKGAGGSLRGGTLPIAQLVMSTFQICSVAHFTCRDSSIEEIENSLMDHHYFGIQNILALRGDPPDGVPAMESVTEKSSPVPAANANRHEYAWQLVQQIRALNAGVYQVRPGFDDAAGGARVPTDFCIGVAAHPEHEPFADAVAHFKKKVENGAQFAITQMLFSAEPYGRFVEACRKADCAIPILPGIRVVSHPATADRMQNKFGVHVPESLKRALGATKNKAERREIGLEFAQNLCRDLISMGAPGVHVFVMSDAEIAAELMGRVRL